MQRLDPKLDIVFKLLLTREPALLLDMLEAILARPLRDATVLDPDIPGDLTGDKQIVLDIRAQLDDGSRADLEMQVRLVPALASRLVYYGARDYAKQLARGEGYAMLTPTVVIAWLVDPLFPMLDRLHAIFELRERHTHLLFGDQLTIHLIQLAALPTVGASGYALRVERWARFLMASDDAELERLASEDAIMALAKKTLDQLSQDPDMQWRARVREDEIKLYDMDIRAIRKESRAKGQAEILLKQLALRFGPLPTSTRTQVEAATLEQLDTWAERVLTVASLAEVLAP